MEPASSWSVEKVVEWFESSGLEACKENFKGKVFLQF
jgi:SAM domain (Sterile alpha motif)